MFQKTEVAELQRRKQELVAQSELNRRALAAEWWRLQSPDHLMDEAGGFLRRHPILLMSLATAGGTLAVRLLRRPRNLAGRTVGVGKFLGMALAAWRLIARRRQ